MIDDLPVDIVGSEVDGGFAEYHLCLTDMRLPDCDGLELVDWLQTHAAGVPVAAGILFPVFGVLLSPMIAALAMSFSSVSVIANALRLRNQKI